MRGRKNIVVEILCAALGLLFLQPSLIQAADFPRKPISLIVPYAAGGSTDVLARALAKGSAKYFPVQVMVVNQAGRGGNSRPGERGERQAGRVHPPLRVRFRRGPGHSPHHENPLRSIQGPGAGLPDFDRFPGSVGPLRSPGQEPEGVRRLGQEAEPADHRRGLHPGSVGGHHHAGHHEGGRGERADDSLPGRGRSA